jgi:hypothetical protein
LLTLQSGSAEVLPSLETAPRFATACTRATFAIKEKGLASRDWTVSRIFATSATGEKLTSLSGHWVGDALMVDFQGPLWLDEPAWKLRVEVSRIANYSSEDLWKITQVPVPTTREICGGGAMTNLNRAVLEFLGLSSPGAILRSGNVGVSGRWNAHLRTPYPVEDLRFSLVEVRDQLGHIAELKGSTSITSDGGRGITPREMLYGFGFELPPGAETLDLTFAVTQSRYVEFQTKSILAKSKTGG